MVKKKLEITNKVKSYCDRKGIDKNQFVALCLNSPLSTDTGRTLSIDTATRIYSGDTNITLPTAGLVAAALGVDLSEIFEIK